MTGTGGTGRRGRQLPAFDDRMLIVTDLGDSSGMIILNQLLNNGTTPDGIFTANDTSAVSLICELKRKGYRVPDDIAVAGFNDDPVSRIVEPNLTTVHYPGGRWERWRHQP
jgi:LacI family transcriptional regulator